MGAVRVRSPGRPSEAPRRAWKLYRAGFSEVPLGLARGGPMRSQEGVRRSQQDPGGPRRNQEETGGARRTQEEPGGRRERTVRASGETCSPIPPRPSGQRGALARPLRPDRLGKLAENQFEEGKAEGRT